MVTWGGTTNVGGRVDLGGREDVDKYSHEH